ncbi:hypothetical protein EYF80_019195 [Liparis tanakae]|uniref:Uncharacterized protein n=1 Tax=Liparis tanakae TaxID=230148 RepID=A0A4Z2HYG2_9TELE|nr:hypothetical protein EYF80_019195 [Liparis tanakae]
MAVLVLGQQCTLVVVERLEVLPGDELAPVHPGLDGPEPPQHPDLLHVAHHRGDVQSFELGVDGVEPADQMSSVSFTVNEARLAPFTSTSLHSLFCGVLSTGDGVAYTGLAPLDTGAAPLFIGVPFASKRSALNW